MISWTRALLPCFALVVVACSGDDSTTAASASSTTEAASTSDGGTTEATAATEAMTTTTAASGTESDGASSSSTTTADTTTGFDDPVMCSSNTYWTMGNHESPLMHPGMACVTCHKTQNFPKPPIFLAAGTVYPSGHEPDDCNGVAPASGAMVVLTDAMGVAYELPVNAAGNFFLETAADGFPLPFTAKVVVGDQERLMLAPQMNGDCNSCHTQDGTMNAPGRIVTP